MINPSQSVAVISSNQREKSKGRDNKSNNSKLNSIDEKQNFMSGSYLKQADGGLQVEQQMHPRNMSQHQLHSLQEEKYDPE